MFNSTVGLPIFHQKYTSSKLGTGVYHVSDIQSRGPSIIQVGETGAQWIRNLLFQYITDPLRVTGIF